MFCMCDELRALCWKHNITQYNSGKSLFLPTYTGMKMDGSQAGIYGIYIAVCDDSYMHIMIYN